MNNDNSIKTPQVIISNEPTLQEKKEATEQERIKNWRERQAKQLPSFSYEAITEGNSICLKTKFNNPDATEMQKYETQNASLCAATGSASEKYGRLMLEQTIKGFFADKHHDAAFMPNAVHEALLAMKPADEIEGMLISRLLVLHDQNMNYMRRAKDAEYQETIDLNLNRATKIGRLYNETLEALNRHRRKGEQKVTVQHQHVNVNNGGQAVVAGQFTQGDHEKK